jgi:hypothetical protein
MSKTYFGDLRIDLNMIKHMSNMFKHFKPHNLEHRDDQAQILVSKHVQWCQVTFRLSGWVPFARTLHGSLFGHWNLILQSMPCSPVRTCLKANKFWVEWEGEPGLHAEVCQMTMLWKSRLKFHSAYHYSTENPGSSAALLISPCWLVWQCYRFKFSLPPCESLRMWLKVSGRAATMSRGFFKSCALGTGKWILQYIVVYDMYIYIYYIYI